MNGISDASLQAMTSSPFDPAGSGHAIQARLAMAATAKVLSVQREMGNQLVALLDPNLGANIDRRA